MSGTLQKGVSLGPSGVTVPTSVYSYLAPNVANHYAVTSTPWIKFWAPLPEIFPASGVVNMTPVAALANQIAAARANGLKVILTCWQFPVWINGYTETTTDQPGQAGKGARYRLPDDISTGSAFAGMTSYLLSWFSAGSSRSSSPNPNAIVDVLEIVNEPNSMLWPQVDASGNRWAGCHVGQMMQLALTINSWYGNQTIIGGPGITDARVSGGVSASGAVTDAVTFATDFVSTFTNAGVTPGPKALFTMHNYGDIAPPGGSTTLWVPKVREQALRGVWAGYPSANVHDPRIWITESGITYNRLAELGYTGISASFEQSFLIENGLIAMANDGTGTGLTNSGAGVDVYVHYLFETDPGFDSGLMEVTGAARIAYSEWVLL